MSVVKFMGPQWLYSLSVVELIMILASLTPEFNGGIISQPKFSRLET